jgi:RNA polymerase sigma-70 factor (ECF subfamily)
LKIFLETFQTKSQNHRIYRKKGKLKISAGFFRCRGGDCWLERTDSEIIQKCLAGDRDIFAELVNRYKRLIYGVIYNVSGDTSEANDLFQEVFLKIYKSLHRYNADYQFSTWAVKITTNVCRDRIRQKKNEPLPIEEIGETGDGRDNPELQYLARERRNGIRRAIRELPEKYRIPIILFHQQKLSYEEMAQILDQPITIIKNRLYRARLMLRDKLSRSGEGGVSDEV